MGIGSMRLAASLAVAALASDCLEARDPIGSIFLPGTSLRGAAIATIASCVIAPIVVGTIPELIQRAVGIVLSVLVAIYGTHEADSNTRASEVLFVAICATATIIPSLTDGLLHSFDKAAPLWSGGDVARNADPTLAIIAYVGGCLLRSGLFACENVVRCANISSACMTCDAMAPAATAAVGAACIATTTGVLWSLAHGRTGDARLSATIGTTVCFVAQSVTLVSIGTLLTDMTQLFPTDAAAVDAVELQLKRCEAAIEIEECTNALSSARRCALSTWSLGTSLFATASLASLALALERPTRTSRSSKLVEVAALCIGSGAFVFTLCFESTWNGYGISTELAVVLAGLGVIIGATYGQLMGAMTVYSALAVETLGHWHLIDRLHFTYLTTISNSVLSIGFVLLLFVVIYRRMKGSGPLNDTLDIVLCLSMQGASFLLALLTTVCVTLYDGRDLSTLIRFEIDVSGVIRLRRALARIVLWHYIPVIVWTMLRTRAAAQRGNQRMSKPHRWIAWVSAVIIAAIAWVCSVASYGTLPNEYPLEHVYSIFVSVLFVAIPPFLFAC